MIFYIIVYNLYIFYKIYTMKPREKLIKYWSHSLESWELVATILWSWIKWLWVFAISKKVSKIIELKKEQIKIDDLLKIKWIWKVKAIQIISSFELVNRYFYNENIIISSVLDILEQVKDIKNKKQEHFLCLSLDWANRLINKRIVTIWLLTKSLVHPREVFVWAIEDRANSIIVVHNHPSWIIKPSKEDIEITMRLQKTSEIIGIKLKDHIIITKNEYYSFLDNKLL